MGIVPDADLKGELHESTGAFDGCVDGGDGSCGRNDDRGGARVRGVIVESRSGREAFYGKSFVDCTAYGDLAACAGARYTEPNDYAVCNSVGIGNVSIDKYYTLVKAGVYFEA